ncbi:MAG: UDP-glucose/GDP-mannose dehydrogenase family protein [Gammaproteobacteria bacterium]|jgi:UDPglucose 6-dehydrogenase|nr:UDP-glucose/GDP-mannose dehydrogenase family protein [Gammaproteobacteria bacterium]|tara:strand:+ start:974 stop:2302 length:1329 start_codon:yes stop_codon:yes gene_type:complete
MKVTMFGTGYVGLVTGTCLADAGHDVICVDIDTVKVSALKEGTIPIHEPGLTPLVIENQKTGTLRFTTSAEEGVDHAEIIFIAVGTPPDEDGSADLQYVLAAAGTIGQHMHSHKIVVTKSTVPVGTSEKVHDEIVRQLALRNSDLTHDVVSNPEFLKEGAAVADFQKPDRIIVGTKSDSAREKIAQLYAPFNRNHNKLVYMDARSAELTKYAANAMLATRISFMNEMAHLAERLGADIEHVRHGIGSDPRIGYQFIYSGCGYGGSCFPKDVRALARTAEQAGYTTNLLNAVETVNDRQKTLLFKKLMKYFQQNVKGKTIALWGLAFKPNTDDMREAPSRPLMESLWQAGAKVQAYDPEAMEETQRIYSDQPLLALMGTKEAALAGADALVICTEWHHFRAPDFDRIIESLTEPVIIDGRNLYEPQTLKDKGFYYVGIGRGEV